jgi:thiosulfate/3-mercaptopyruvate sulfurtransferase
MTRTILVHLLAKPYLLLAASVCLFAVLPSMATQAPTGNLVSVQWLAKNLQSPDILVLDASPPPMHAKQHIAGAVNVDVFRLASFGVRDLPLSHAEGFYKAAGISPGKKLVLYDGYPVGDLLILDGGLAKWQAQGLPVTKDATPAPAAGTFRVTKVNEAARVRIPELVAASGDRADKVLLDALGPEYHYGATAFFDKPGHIPHAVLLPSEDLFNADKTFKSPEEMRRMLAHLSIRPGQEIHAHCGGGGAASVPYFALKHIAGHSKVKLSLESQMGWLQDDRDLPFWTYGSPQLVRETDWLQSWGGRMMRMYGVSRVSVVDVRSAPAYTQGHLPFSVNVPPDVIRGNAADPARLAEVLGTSGVNPTHEAVVVSGGGLTKDAALAFVLLEKMGQKKVSVFMDSLESVESLDKLARKGFAVTKEPTKLPPASYTVAARAESPGARAYPKVYIASGAAVPAKPPEGKVVHVPYTSLLNADGTPKAAKDIWAILEKAGVSRYAELVTFSDDPGEAAVNYFVLKLMGFPDAKVLEAKA